MHFIKKALIFSFPIYIIGYVFSDELIIFLSGSLFSLIFLIELIRKENLKEINPMVLYIFSIGITSFANFIGVLSIGKDNEYVYNLYSDIQSIYEASVIHYYGIVFLSLGFYLFTQINWLPRISYKVKNEKSDYYLYILSLVLIFIIVRNLIPGFLGAIKSLIIGLPLFYSFYLVKKGIINKRSKYLVYGFSIVLILSIFEILFSYLRSNMIKPIVFFILAYVMGYENIRVLFRWKLIPIYVFMLLFISYFGIFGSQRAYIGLGRERIENLVELKKTEQIAGETPFSRASNFNQLSQVVKITKDEGYLQGESLEYLTYVFIPRFVWPEKPLIQMGAWFAEKIGLGWRDADGKYHNSINMTIPGELFLNYGYIGLIIGSFIIGFILRLFWNTVISWKDSDDIFANVFAAYLLFIGLFSFGADIQIIITILATYLILLFLNKFVFKNV